MNDAIRELLSAYLDGALPEVERRDVEERLSRSEELRAELESLRAVSNAVKGLPKAKLPGGFQARLQARLLREGGSTTERQWWILPPAFRPVAFALSSAIVAFVVWDKAHPPVENARTLWDGVDNVALDRVAVKSAAEAPSSVNLAGGVAGTAPGADEFAKKEDAAEGKGVSPSGRRAAAPGKPLEFQESDGVAAVRGASAARALGDVGAGAAGQPAAPSASVPSAAPAPVAPAEGVFQARTEEERSAMNERLYQNFEQEKKRMGIAQIIEKDSDDKDSSGGARFAALSAAPEPRAREDAKPAPKRQYGMIAGASGRKLSKAKAAASVSPEDAPAAAAPAYRALALKTPEALAAAWAGAGLAGDPPPVDFPAQMAIFLAGPSGGGIVEVQERKKVIVVLYKDSGFDDPISRVRAVTASRKPVVVKPAE